LPLARAEHLVIVTEPSSSACPPPPAELYAFIGEDPSYFRALQQHQPRRQAGHLLLLKRLRDEALGTMHPRACTTKGLHYHKGLHYSRLGTMH